MSDLESERLDRIEQHLRLLKQDSETRAADIREIKQALIGSPLNDHKGLVWKINNIDARVESLEVHESEIKLYVKQGKFVIAGIVAALITLMIEAFTKK
jgi:hypothetical protein